MGWVFEAEESIDYSLPLYLVACVADSSGDSDCKCFVLIDAHSALLNRLRFIHQCK